MNTPTRRLKVTTTASLRCFALLLALILAGAPAAFAGSGTWTNNASGVWSAPVNWLNGNVADGVGATANFSTVDLTAPATVTVDASHNIGTLLFGDNAGVNAESWTLNPSGGSTLTLAAASGSPTIAVSNNPVNTDTALLNVSLAGGQGLTKMGNGTLILGTNNASYSGMTTISGGRLAQSAPLALGVNTANSITNPILYMSFDKMVGNTVYNEGSGGAVMNGTLVGAAQIVGGGRLGGNCLSIPAGGSSVGYVQINNPVVALASNNTWTVALWIKTSTTGGAYLYQGNSGWGSGNMSFYLNSGSGAGTHAGGVSFGNAWEQGSTNIADGNWHFIAMTSSGTNTTGTNLTMYVDGNVDTVQSVWGTGIGVGKQFWIGGSYDDINAGEVGLNGLIDEVSVFNTNLTQVQVQTLMTAGTVVAGAVPAGSPVSAAASSTLDLNGKWQQVGGLNGAGTVDSTLAGGTPVLVVNNSSPTTGSFGGVISNTAGTLSLYVAGTNSQTINGTAPSTYNGSTIVAGGGTLIEDFANATSANNLINSSSPLVLGDGTLQIKEQSATTTSQTFNGTTINPGYTAVIGTGVGGGSLTVALGAITHNVGGTVDFTNTSTGYITTTTPTNDGILGGWATVGNNLGNQFTGDWATTNGSGQIVPYSGYTLISPTASSTPSLTGSATQNWETGSPNNAGNYITTLSASATINSLVQCGDFNVPSGDTLTIGSGGYMVRGVSRWLLNNNAGSTAGTAKLASGLATGELYLHAPWTAGSGNWTIWPVIIDGAVPTTVVKDGPGLICLGNFNTYTGGTVVNGGTLQLIAGGATGAIRNWLTINPGATVLTTAGNAIGYTAGVEVREININGGTLNTSYAGDEGYNTTFNLVNGGTLTSNGGTSSATATSYWVLAQNTKALNGASGINCLPSSATCVVAGRVDMRNFSYSPSQTFTVASGSTTNGIDLLVSAVLTGSAAGGGLGNTALVKAGAGTMLLSGANTYTGGTTNNAGTMVIANNAAFGTGVLTMNGGSISNNAGTSYTVANNLNLLTAAGVGVNTGDILTLSGTISGAGGITKVGGGNVSLSSADTYSGNTTINGGTLALGASASLNNSANIRVAAGAIFDVSAVGGGITLGGSQSLFGAGTNNGSISTSSGSQIYADNGSGYATNTFNGSLTIASGATTYFNVGTVHNGSNDLINVVGGGTLTDNGAIGSVGISAPSTSVNLDSTADYVLITAAGGNLGTVSSTPLWGTKPLNWRNFSIVQSGNNIQLHYNASTAPAAIGAASPNPAVGNQNVLVSVTVTPGTGSVDPNNGVTLNAGSLGLSTSIPLVLSSVANVYTNTITVPPATLAGNYPLTATVTDSTPLSGIANFTLTNVTTTEVWNGAGGNQYWDTNPNWVGSLAPGYVGDSLIFAGSAGLTPDMDQNYTVSSITFSNNAGGFSIGSAESDTLTLTNSGVIANNSANAQTLSMTIADSGGGLSKTGSGTVILSGNNNYTGPTTVSAGTLNVSGTVASTNITTVASTATNAVLINSGSLSQYTLLVGNVSNAVAVVYQTGGSASITGGGGDCLDVGNVMGAFGYYDMTGGSVSANGIAVGGENNNGSGLSGTGGNGIMEISGGTLSDSGWVVLARGATTETGVLNVFSGSSLTYAGGGISGCWGSGGQTSIINMLGGGIANSIAVGINLNDSGNVTNTGILNLDGGTAQANSVIGTAGRVNFNGGTLMAYNANTSFMNGLGSVNVYGGGAIIDDNGTSIGINAALLAPAGNGVNGIASYTPGAGYIAPPIVTVAPGAGDITGVGATAIAQINPTSGQVTNVLVTCPGVNYTAIPTFVLSGGGATTPATITGQTPTANSSGGLTKIDGGTLTLGGSSTYTGSTTISDGTLQLSAPVLHMTFDNVSGTTVVNQGSGGSGMNGTLTGTASITSGGRFGNCLSIPAGASTAAYVAINSPVVSFTEAANWTWGMWIKTSTAGGTYMYQGNGTTWATGYSTFYLNPGATGAGTHMGGVRFAQGWETGTAAVNDGNWHFIAMTDNGGTRTMYVDGVVDSITDNAWNGTGVGTMLYIGGNGPGETDGQVGLGGLIDEVYVYSRALSQTEVQALYNNNNSQVLPTTTAVNVASGATFDVSGVAQTIGSLSGPSGSTVTLVDVPGETGTLTVANTSSNNFPGTIQDNSTGTGALILNSTSALTLSGANYYGGPTIVSNGTLWVDGSISTGPATVVSGATLGGSGYVNGALTVNGNLSPGDPGNLSTLTVYNNVTFASGGTCTFSLTTSAGGVNDQLSMTGPLVGNNNVIHIKAPSSSVNLDTTADYILITGYSGITGGFSSTPAWDVRPLNYQNYTVQNISGNIVLHYSLALPPTAAIALTPNTVTRNQSTLITVTATPGSNPISGATVDTSAIGGSSTYPLVQVGSTHVYTNSVTVSAGIAPGTYGFLATVTDTVSLSGTAGTNLTVTVANDIWNGLGVDNNWDTNPNWVNSVAPGYAGDSLVFAGSTDLAPNMDNNYTVTSVTFSNNAGSFNLGTSGSTLTLTNASVVVNNSTHAQTLNVPVVFATAGTVTAAAGTMTLAGTVDNGGNLLTVTGTTNVTISGLLSDNGGLTMSGGGTLTLTANNTYAGATTVTGGGTLVLAGNNSYAGATTVSGGTFSLPASGTVANNAITYVGGTAGNSELINGGSLSQEVLLIGNANGAVGAVYQTNGTVSAATATTFDNTSIGNIAGGFGYYDANGGTFTSDGIALGGENNNGSGFSGTGGSGIMDITGGTVTDTGWFVMARGATNETGVLNVYNGGSMTFAGGGLVCNWGTGQTSIINMLGGSVASAISSDLPLNFNGVAGDVGILNCNSGTFQTSWIEGTIGVVNFNGGTLAATKAQAVFLDGLAGAYVYGGGATINNNSFAVVVPQSLLAPTGYGVSSISLSGGGTGYIAPPIVTLSGGAGSGATAIAQINTASGVITNILVTSAGINYLSSDTLTVTFAGGGGSGATANTPVLAANTSGGLTAAGTGTLTLTAANTYTGNTVITNGTLLLSGSGSIADSAHINVTSGSTFDVSAVNFTLASGQTLMGNGTVNGSVTNSGTIAPGSSGTIGALTFNNNLALQAGGVTSVKLNKSLSPSNDVVTVTGALTYGGTLAVANLGGALIVGDSFQLFNAGSETGSLAISGSPGAGMSYSFNPSTGVLSVVAGGPSPFSGTIKFTGSPVVSGTSLTISGTNSGSGVIYLLTSTNLVAPVSTWTPVWTNVLIGNGNFTTNLPHAVNPAFKQQFYILCNTNY